MYLSVVELRGISKTIGCELMTSILTETRTTAQYSLFEAIKYRRYRQAKLLVEAGVNIDIRNEKGETPLICTAVQLDDMKIRIKFARLFLDAGADPNLQDWSGLTALMYAAINDQPDMVLALLESRKTDVGIQDQEGNTALIHAAANGQSDVIAVLINTFHHLKIPLNLEQKNNDGHNALFLAKRNGHDMCAQLLTREASPMLVLQEMKVEDYIPTPTPISENNNVNSSEQNEINLPLLNKSETEEQNNLPAVNSDQKKATEKVIDQTNSDEATQTKPKIRILPLLSLQHVGQMEQGLQAGDSWEWDLGASNARSGKQKVKCRPLDTGSRSLSESRGKLSDSWNYKRLFNSSEQIGRDSRTSSSLNNEMLTRITDKDMCLPPIRCKTSTQKKQIYLTIPDDIGKSETSDNIITNA